MSGEFFVSAAIPRAFRSQVMSTGASSYAMVVKTIGAPISRAAAMS